MVFTIDGKQYNVFVTELTRSAEIRDGKASGETKSGEYFRDIVGTYYSYDMTIGTDSLSEEDYDALYETITAPVESHEVTLPYGRSELSFTAYITAAEDVLQSIRDHNRNWRELAVTFQAKRPQRRPI